MFAGSNFDAEDFDDYNVLQRDMQVDGGLRPVTEEDVIRVRHETGKAVQAVFKYLGLTEVTDEQVEAVTYAHGSKDTLKRDVDVYKRQAIMSFQQHLQKKRWRFAAYSF